MNQKSQLSALGGVLIDSLGQIDKYEKQTLAHREKDTVHIATVGSTISTAYEQLRNASEYAEDELLQQRAIRRYLNRVLSFHTKIATKGLAEELVTELTQAEYLQNDYVTTGDLKAITKNISTYYGAYWKYADATHSLAKRAEFQKWALDVLAVRCEQVLRSHLRQLMFAHFAFTYLHDKMPMQKMIRENEKIAKGDLALVLYIAIHRAILKSDAATIRTALIDSYRQDISDIDQFESFNHKLDSLLESKTVAYTTRIVSRNGAALRFIYSGFYSSDVPISVESLKSPDTLDYALRRHIEHDYRLLSRRLDRGVVRSIFFLLITKTIIGAVVEVPYDLMVSGAIIWIPLIINLLFPSVFIALSRLTLTVPGVRNTDAIISQVTGMLFANERATTTVRIPKESRSIGFTTAYIITFLLVFGGLSYLLYLLEFNIVQGVIFFIFLSTAAFLAFRLSRQIHELEVIHASQDTLSLLRDVIYMPFIYVGQQISYRYSQINIIAIILDILIELPLKTILRLVRQWMLFLNDKKDELI